MTYCLSYLGRRIKKPIPILLGDLKKYHKCGKCDIYGSIPKFKVPRRWTDLQQRSEQLVTPKHHQQQSSSQGSLQGIIHHGDVHWRSRAKHRTISLLWEYCTKMSPKLFALPLPLLQTLQIWSPWSRSFKLILRAKSLRCLWFSYQALQFRFHL